MQSFSNRLIALRKERGMTQQELAKALVMSRSTLSGYETEGKEPPFDALCKFASFFDVTTDYLLGISSARTHNDVVFTNDTRNFSAAYDHLPATVKTLVAASFDSFYLILSRDMKLGRTDRLELYRELFGLIQKDRADIRNTLENKTAIDPLALSDVITKQSNFKNEVSVLLDRLMQADMGIRYTKKGSDTVSSVG